MMRFLTILCLFFISFYVYAQTSPDLEKFFNQPDLNGALIGVSVKEITSKKILFEKNSHFQLVPASIFKLLITLASIEKLGENFKFKTEVFLSGKIADSSLKGNIIIKGYGDPTIQSRFFNSSALQNISLLLKNKGIKSIAGKIIIINNYFQPKVNDNWAYEDVNNYYAAIPYPVNIFDNQYHLYLYTENPDKYASFLKIEPQYLTPPKILLVSNNVIAKEGGDNAYIYGDPLGYEKRIEGSIPPFQKSYSIEGALPDPARMFAESLIQKLNAENIRISFKDYHVYNDTFTLPGMQLLGTVFSPALSEIIRLTNLHSINLFAEAMMYAIGNGDYQQGKKELLNFAVKSGINPNEINIDDACGLSRLNGISADAMTELLIKLYSGKNAQILLNSLPLTGESGTMKNFSDTEPLKSNLKCKTGYVQRVRTYAGFMNTKSGKTIAVCIMYNHFNTSPYKIKNITKAFFESIYQKY